MLLCQESLRKVDPLLQLADALLQLVDLIEAEAELCSPNASAMSAPIAAVGQNTSPGMPNICHLTMSDQVVLVTESLTPVDPIADDARGAVISQHMATRIAPATRPQRSALEACPHSPRGACRAGSATSVKDIGSRLRRGDWAGRAAPAIWVQIRTSWTAIPTMGSA